MTLPLLDLVDAPVLSRLIEVHLRCPACQHEWHAATIDVLSWWGKGVKAETIAKQSFCKRCHAEPPMEMV